MNVSIGGMGDWNEHSRACLMTSRLLVAKALYKVHCQNTILEGTIQIVRYSQVCFYTVWKLIRNANTQPNKLEILGTWSFKL